MGDSSITAEQLWVKGSDCPPALACYVFVWQPHANIDPNKSSKFQITLVWPESTDLSKLKLAAQAAARKKWGQHIPPNLKNPFRRGNVERVKDGVVDPIFKDKVFITARSKDKPVVVGPNKQVIVNEMDFYSGCMCKVALTAFAYEREGSKGVAFALGPVQKISDGQRLSGRRDPDDEFQDEGGGAAPAGGSDIDNLF